jgi:hypothetical protein
MASSAPRPESLSAGPHVAMKHPASRTIRQIAPIIEPLDSMDCDRRRRR